MPVAQVGDVRLYYEIHGADHAEPLVLICGLALDISEITTLINGLASGYRVLAFDNRGAGRSDKPDAPYTIEMMAADTAAVMRAAGMPHATVLGISMGGRIALALALAEPGMVDRLILVSTTARVVQSLRRRVMRLGFLLPIGQGAHPQPGYAFRRQLRASDGFDVTDRLAEIRVPAVIMHGRHDKSAPLALATEMHARLPEAEMRIFRGGHIFMLAGQRKAFITAVLDGRNMRPPEPPG